MKQKIFSIISKGLSMSQIKESFFQEGESPTFIKFLHSFLKSHKSEILF